MCHHEARNQTLGCSLVSTNCYGVLTHTHTREILKILSFVRGQQAFSSRTLSTLLSSLSALHSSKGFQFAHHSLYLLSKSLQKRAADGENLLEFILKTLLAWLGLSLKKKPAIFTNALNEFFLKQPIITWLYKTKLFSRIVSGFLPWMVMMKFVNTPHFDQIPFCPYAVFCSYIKSCTCYYVARICFFKF